METRMVTGGPDLETIRDLFRQYEKQIGVDLCFQGFSGELAGLPGDYAPPHGALILATAAGAAAGCVAVHRWDESDCEMKRLFVHPDFQGSGIGKALTLEVIAWARDRGYRHLLLDTLPSMKSAQRMYERFGFEDIEPYRPSPIEGTRYMRFKL